LIEPDLSIGSQPSSVLASNNDFSGDTLAAYLQDQVDLNSHWKALLGLRWDRYRQTLYNELSPSSPPLERTDIQTSPRAGLVWQPSDSQSIYASWSHSFQPSGDGLSLAKNTAELEPEQSSLREIGWKAEWLGGDVISTFALFEQIRDNLRTVDPLDPTRLIQVGEQRTRGLEFELAGQVGERLDLRFAYAHLDAEITQSNDKQSGVALAGNQPGNVPENSASAWAVYQAYPNFDIGLGAVAVGERFTANDDLVRMPGYVRADALLRWRSGAHELALNLKNLGNTLYYESAHTTHQIMPGAPRSANLTWRLNF
jgi:catecholate siderophore receptor